VLLLTQQQVLDSSAGQELIIEAMVAATVGGFSSVTGAFVAGLSLGVAQGLYGRYVSGATEIVVAFLVVVVVLMVRKEGLFSGASLREA
jgi:branched-chain amino acid transport system permease protein